MYSITITITCNHKNQRLQITFQLLKTCNRLHVITITDDNYNRSDCRLLCLLPVTFKVIVANSVDPDQTAPLGAV